MYAHEYVRPVSYLAAHKSDVSLLVDLILKCIKTELSVFGRELRRIHALHHRLRAHSEGDQVCDGDQWHVVPTSETTQLRNAGHRAVLVHDFAYDASGVQTG